MLKPIVQQMNLLTESRLREAPSLIAVLAHHHRNLRPSGNQQRLVAEIPRQPAWVHQQYSPSLSPIASREHIKANAPLLQQLAQQNNERSFPRTPSQQIPAHARASNSCNPSAVRVVAPVCARMVSPARCPKARRSSSFASNSSNTSGNSAGPTIFTASRSRNKLTMSRKFSV